MGVNSFMYFLFNYNSGVNINLDWGHLPLHLPRVAVLLDALLSHVGEGIVIRRVVVGPGKDCVGLSEGAGTLPLREEDKQIKDIKICDYDSYLE